MSANVVTVNQATGEICVIDEASSQSCTSHATGSGDAITDADADGMLFLLELYFGFG